MFRLICIIIGYAFGCIQSSYIFGKTLGKIDVRDYGSGNAGFTNTTRVLGKKIGALVFICDLLKVCVAFAVSVLLFKSKMEGVEGDAAVLPGIYAGLGAVLGHNFPFYMQFRGGKGIACTLGLMLCIDWRVALITYVLGFILFLITKYVSLSSIVMVVLYPVFMIIFKPKLGFSGEEIILMVVLCVLAIYRHRTNIQRLLNGTERKFGTKKKDSAVKIN
jgi:glycerol-3-phosphate acyltransferase PlsY